MFDRKIKEQVPLYVDLDGTLIKSDIAQELLTRVALRPDLWGQALSCILTGRAGLKHLLAENIAFDPATLPYTPEVVDYLQQERARGRRIILATAANRICAEKIAEHMGIFDKVLASTPEVNLKGKAKLAAIQADADGEFEYLGNDRPDEVIWDDALNIGIVNAPRAVQNRAMKADKTSLLVEDRPSTTRGLIKAMRPHQWAKNVLILLPLFFSHSYGDMGAVTAALMAMAVFSLCASAIYIINDLLDIEADRKHATKCNRPFAAGVLSPVKGAMASFGLLAIAFTISITQFAPAVTGLFALYILMTTLYSAWFKHKAAIDIVVLTCLYTLRIFVGGVAIGVLVSPALLNFSLFFFASLALMKRFTEIQKLEAKPEKTKVRGYFLGDNQTILAMGTACGGLAVLTLTLYFNSGLAAETYRSPTLLWLTAPLVLFWIFRAWLLAMRSEIDEDPVVFALRDNISRVAILSCAALVIFGRNFAIEGWLV